MIQVKFYHSSYFSISFSSSSVYIISFLFFSSNFHGIEDGRIKDLIYWKCVCVCDIVNRRMKKKNIEYVM